MSDKVLLKNKLLLVASSGSFAAFDPPTALKYYHETEAFLNLHADSLDSIELYNLFELQFYLSLITKHDITAKVMLDRILDQFGSNKKSQRIKLLQSLYHEATGEKDKALELLGKDSDEVRLSRRLTTFSRHEDASNEKYITNLNFYLELQPSDLHAWAELADEYTKAGHYDKAVFALKEVLLQEPFAYPIFYKVGLNYYYWFLQEDKNLKNEKKEKLLELFGHLLNARNNFLRTVEICDVYSKSWLGVNFLTKLDYNAKLAKIESKEVKKYLEENEKLRELSERKLQAQDKQ